MKKEEKLYDSKIGNAFEDLSCEEMMECSGGGTTATSVTPTTTVPCLLGASLGSIIVSVTFVVFG